MIQRTLIKRYEFCLIDDKLPLFTCEEITEIQITTHEINKVRNWKEIETIFQNDQNREKQVKQKMMNVWNGGIGQLICNVMLEKLGKQIAFKRNYDLAKYDYDRSKVHCIFMLDNSGVMGVKHRLMQRMELQHIQKKLKRIQMQKQVLSFSILMQQIVKS
ncbi:unnamed protein product [Paramecium sonneborni]|uniref:Uncharacterized protein n=1 Tax=Paramecium sonneborni TaxID=65129 RepID=A0A8S1QUP3_9CILI|nr:unnamed protein product [Paramecium sonneborni]